jgi:hypothetical protein
VRIVSIFAHHKSLSRLVIILAIAGMLSGCGNKETGKVLLTPSLSPIQLSSVSPTVKPTTIPIIKPTPTPFVLGPLFDPKLDIKAGPVEVPLELWIPSLNVSAPVLGVGLIAGNVMDSPRGELGNPVWQSAFWYRGSDIPGNPGTAAIAGHVNDPLGRPEIFAHLEDMQHGDFIVIRIKNTPINMIFIVNDVKNYTVKESSDPKVLAKIYGAKAVFGKAPTPAPDDPSYLTLITCAGDIVDGQFDHHTVVFATRSK